MKTEPIGLFDSGVGGLSVLKQFVKFLPNESYIYLGDTARVPYGNKSEATINKYAEDCTQFLINKGVKMIVVACNTLSAVALDTIQNIAKDIDVVGMIKPAASDAVRTTYNNKIGVIGTRATINSNVYKNAILEISSKNYGTSEIEVFSQECPLFVPFVEEGYLNHPAITQIAEEYLLPLKNKNIDTLVLGCTHYPFLKQLISHILDDITLIDTGESAAIVALRKLAKKDLLSDENLTSISGRNVKIFVTDYPNHFFSLVQSLLGFTIDSPELVEL